MRVLVTEPGDFSRSGGRGDVARRAPWLTGVIPLGWRTEFLGSERAPLRSSGGLDVDEGQGTLVSYHLWNPGAGPDRSAGACACTHSDRRGLHDGASPPRCRCCCRVPATLGASCLSASTGAPRGSQRHAPTQAAATAPSIRTGATAGVTKLRSSQPDLASLSYLHEYPHGSGICFSRRGHETFSFSGNRPVARMPPPRPGQAASNSPPRISRPRRSTPVRRATVCGRFSSAT